MPQLSPGERDQQARIRQPEQRIVIRTAAELAEDRRQNIAEFDRLMADPECDPRIPQEARQAEFGFMDD